MVKLYAVRYSQNCCAAILDQKDKADRLCDCLSALFPRIRAYVMESESFFPSWEREGESDVIKATQAFFDSEKSGIMLHLAIAQAFPDKAHAMAQDRNPDNWASHARAAKHPLIKGLRAIYAAQARGHWIQINGHWRKRGL